MKRRTKIVLALIIGFIVAMILMSIAIYLGYTDAYSTSVNGLTVKLFGIPIYELIKTGTEYGGKTIGIYMGLVCGICVLISFGVEELISRVKHK